MAELYTTLGAKVADQKVLNLEALEQSNYFKTATWVMRKLGLERLFGIQQNYHVDAIQQFYDTVVFGEYDYITLTWKIGRAHV